MRIPCDLRAPPPCPPFPILFTPFPSLSKRCCARASRCTFPTGPAPGQPPHPNPPFAPLLAQCVSSTRQPPISRPDTHCEQNS
ncbi:uncharacterized protein SCHCODRAFT_02635782 [Schizophyllum commune H4-8]|uniref:uncharacterized protein n=1 Tax=Schizophyllum commune (strain H4-8 / FGSC 9210) TaxID=578458 RepID=UPI0021604DDA|nr:uncharacterized protein SCHCODRAFT_02635782 [Schizophyllum commune H4-8]KAI5888128.1 hypothetical protein SCHCODRAFT_02635782 [Schizophyllum commune H4-8]